jgi:hypothetical protein
VVAEPPTPVHRFSLEEYHRLIEAGAFDEDARLGLPPISVAELLTSAG